MPFIPLSPRVFRPVCLRHLSAAHAPACRAPGSVPRRTSLYPLSDRTSYWVDKRHASGQTGPGYQNGFNDRFRKDVVVVDDDTVVSREFCGRLSGGTGTRASTWRYWASIGQGPPSWKLGRRRVRAEGCRLRQVAVTATGRCPVMSPTVPTLSSRRGTRWRTSACRGTPDSNRRFRQSPKAEGRAGGTRRSRRLPGMRKPSRSDRALMASAWADLGSAPRTLMGRSSGTRSACSPAMYRGFCTRCERPIRTARPSSAPRATLPMTVAASRPARTDQAAASPQPPLCPGCHLEHAGECW